MRHVSERSGPAPDRRTGSCYRANRCLSALEEGDGQHVVIFSGQTGKVVRLRVWTWTAICHDPSLLPESLISPLLGAGLIVPLEANELETTLAENRRHEDLQRRLVYAIMPTADCNLGCDYCGQQHHGAVMSPEVAEATVIHLTELLERGGHESLAITWFGGEPLRAARMVVLLSQRLLQVCARIGVAYRASLVTNGTLLNLRLARQLVQEGGIFQVEVTLDGPPEVHDVRRPFRGAAGSSSELILANVVDCCRSLPSNILKVSIRCNVDRRNAHQATGLLETLGQAGLAGRVSVYPCPVYPWGQAVGQTHRLFFEEFAAMELMFMERATQLGFETMSILPARRFVTCLHTERHSRLVGFDGKLFTCTEVPLVPQYESNPGAMAKWCQGSLMDAGAALLPKPNWWAGECGLRMQPCAQCGLFGVCGGRCPRSWLEGAGVCPPFKYNLRERIRLFVKTHELDSPDDAVTQSGSSHCGAVGQNHRTVQRSQ